MPYLRAPRPVSAPFTSAPDRGCTLSHNGLLGSQIASSSNRSRIYSNLHRHAHAARPPRLGAGYEIDLFSQPRYGAVPTVAIPLLGSAAARIPAGAFGLLQLEPAGAVALDPVLIPAPAGRAAFAVAIPANPALFGAPLLSQSLFVSLTGGARLGNLVAAQIAR